jgi:hypothetical protein
LTGFLPDFALRIAVSLSGIAFAFSSCVGIRAQAKNRIPTKIPTNRPAGRDYGRTGATKSSAIGLFLQMFRTTANICEHEVVPRGGLPQRNGINALSIGGTPNCPA